MESAVTVALIAVVPPMILAVVALLQTVRNQRATAAALHEVTTKTESIARKVDEVHEVTNANFSAQRDEITELRRHIEALKETLERYKQFS